MPSGLYALYNYFNNHIGPNYKEYGGLCTKYYTFYAQCLDEANQASNMLILCLIDANNCLFFITTAVAINFLYSTNNSSEFMVYTRIYALVLVSRFLYFSFPIPLYV